MLLRRREDALELRVNGVFAMDTAQTSTERALARAALADCAHPDRFLLGRLGLGFTAAEILRVGDHPSGRVSGSPSTCWPPAG